MTLVFLPDGRNGRVLEDYGEYVLVCVGDPERDPNFAQKFETAVYRTRDLVKHV